MTNKIIKEKMKEFRELRDKKDKITDLYNTKKAELYNLINIEVGNGPEMLIDIPETVPLSPELIKNYVLGKHPEGTITNIDFEKRVVRMFVSADYQRFTLSDDRGTLERRVNRGKPYLDLDLLKIIDKDVYDKVITLEPVLDEHKLEKVILEDEEARESVQNALKAAKPKPALYLKDKKEEEDDD